MGRVIKGILALLVFLVFLTFPFIYNAAIPGEKGSLKLEKAKVAEEKLKGKCLVGKKEWNMSNKDERRYVIANHGDILSHAGVIPGKETPVRDMVVRQGNRKVNGLNGCISCHQNKSNFCAKCHAYVGVHSVNEHTGCFACHFYPKNDNEFKRWKEAMDKSGGHP